MDSAASALLRASLKSQYHASFAMLRQTIEICPAATWSDPEPVNPYWRVVYHTLYFAHLYLQPGPETFEPWAHHQPWMHYLDDLPGPPEIEAHFVDVDAPPSTGVPYTQDQMLAYWDVCDAMVDDAVDALDLQSPGCGFDWYPIPKLEHQMLTLRHIQHHTAQLAGRIFAATGVAIDWVGAQRP